MGYDFPSKARFKCVNSLKSTFDNSQNKSFLLSDFSHISCHLTNPDLVTASFTSPKDSIGDELSFFFASG